MSLRFYSVDEVADMIGVSDKTLMHWVRGGRIRHYKPARGVYRFSEAHVVEYMQAHEVAPHGQPSHTAAEEEDRDEDVLDQPVVRRPRKAKKQELRADRDGGSGRGLPPVRELVREMERRPARANTT